MQKVYIVQVLGWGDDEDAFYNISAHSTQKLADAHIQQIQADWDGDAVINVDVMEVDA